MAFRISGSAALISLATATVLASGAFITLRPTLGLPLVRVMVSAGTATSATVPRSWMAAAGPTRTFAIWSRLVNAPAICKGMTAPLSLSAPTDWTVAAWASAALTWPTPRPCAASFAGSSVTSTSCVGAPVRLTVETPLSPASFGRATDRSWVARSPSDSFAYAAYCNTGTLLVEKVSIVGGCTCAGKAARARSRLVDMACRAAVRSVPSLNWTVTIDAPDDEVESTLVTPATPCSAFTTGRVTCWSTTPGDAPGSAVMTTKDGTEIFGNRSCWSCVAAQMPTLKSRMTARMTTDPRRSERRISGDITTPLVNGGYWIELAPRLLRRWPALRDLEARPAGHRATC